MTRPVLQVSGSSRRNTRVKLDGVPLPNVRNLVLNLSVNEHPTALVEIIGVDLDFTFPMDVNIQLQTFPGYDIVAEQQGNGRTRYRTLKQGTTPDLAAPATFDIPPDPSISKTTTLLQILKNAFTR